MTRLAQLITTYRPDHRPERPFVIAEAGVNHEGSMDTARRLIEQAKAGGADAIKFQTYRAETLAARESPAYWDTSKEPTTSQYELFKRHDKFWKGEFEQLRLFCDETGIEFMSTPFDVESASFLNDLMDVFKVSSSDLTNLPFIRHIASHGKPILLSTGASDVWEIAEAVQCVRALGVPICLMHCVLNYPTDDADANLGMIYDLRRRFPDILVGYSDHTRPNEAMDVLITATLVGAQVLEKHFTHDKGLPGNDHYHSMDQADLRIFLDQIERLFTLLGQFEKRALPSEAPARANARRSLVAAHRIAAGAVVRAEDLTWKRPASGISPREFDNVIGHKAAVDIEEDQILNWAMLEW